MRFLEDHNAPADHNAWADHNAPAGTAHAVRVNGTAVGARQTTKPDVIGIPAVVSAAR